MKDKYQPINCSYYDRLEAWATTKKEVSIKYLEDNEETVVKAKIVDFFIVDGAEFLKLESGLSIRLDFLLEVDGIALPKSC